MSLETQLLNTLLAPKKLSAHYFISIFRGVRSLQRFSKPLGGTRRRPPRGEAGLYHLQQLHTDRDSGGFAKAALLAQSDQHCDPAARVVRSRGELNACAVGVGDGWDDGGGVGWGD